MRNYSDEQILKGILRHDNLILQYIYKEYYYKVSYFIKKNQNNLIFSSLEENDRRSFKIEHQNL